ncbi:MAG TPA: hypothetical protein VHD81_00095 [Mycobacteriales bacterium]|nr:hypothetical protein [Mycobacteriales bacterium]
MADLAVRLAAADHRPPRKATYLRPLRRLGQLCRNGSVSDLDATVVRFGADLKAVDVVATPFAAAEAALVAGARRGQDCNALLDAYVKQINGRLHGSTSLYSGRIQFAPPMTADLALAAIRHSVLPGPEHSVYDLKAFSCQQAIFMGPAIARKYGNPNLGAFVRLTSGKGVGHGKYDAKRVNLARISPLGRIGGQPC